MANEFKTRAVESRPRERIETAGTATVASGAELLATLSTAADVAAYMRTWSDARAEQEVFWVIALDSKHRPLAEPQRVAVGTVNGVSVHPRDVFKVAVRWNAQSVIVVHNHPSGDPSPSREDILLTRRLQEAAQMMGIPLLDHVILGDAARGQPGYVSLGGSVV